MIVVEYATTITEYTETPMATYWCRKPEPVVKELKEYKLVKCDHPCFGGYTAFHEGEICIKTPGWDFAHYVPIKFCPWCGEEINYSEVSRVRRKPYTVEETKAVKVIRYEELREV